MSSPQTDTRGFPSAEEVCGRFQIREESAALLREEMSVEEFASALVEEKRFPDAVSFVAHALPIREAIWWACQCARQTMGEKVPPKILAAIEVAEKWVAEADDWVRRSALPIAVEAGAGTAAGSAALAVFYSGESLALADDDPVYPIQHTATRIVAGGVLSAAATSDPAETEANFRTFVAQGIEIYRATFEIEPQT